MKGLTTEVILLKGLTTDVILLKGFTTRLILLKGITTDVNLQTGKDSYLNLVVSPFNASIAQCPNLMNLSRGLNLPKTSFN